MNADADSHHVLASWVTEAKCTLKDNPASYAPPNLETLCGVLIGGAFQQATVATERDSRDRPLIELTTLAPDNATMVNRYMLPAHAATTRALELAGGRIALILGSGGAIHKAYFDLVICGIRTNLHRILFGLTSTGRLWEMNESVDQHRYITPSAYKLGQGTSREVVLHAIEERNARRRSIGPWAEGSRPVQLLIDLFAISDIWHWDELVGRRETGEGRRYGLADFSKL